MTEHGDRVEEALAAHLEHLEFGGPEPDVSHLTPAELEQLRNLIALLDQTEGVGFGRGLDETRVGAAAATEAGERVVAVLRDALPPAARIAIDTAGTTVDVAGVVEGWVVGTFGGRVRVWLLAEEGSLTSNDDWIRGLDRVFRLFPDTVAIALVEPDLSCLLVQPEDCAPVIEVPRGSLVAHRYRRPLHPVGEALSVFLRELIPYWEPMRGIEEQTTPAIDVEPVVRERASRAVEEQAAAGARARKTNPKRKALTELGSKEAGGIAELALGIHEGRVRAEDVEDMLRRMAQR